MTEEQLREKLSNLEISDNCGGGMLIADDDVNAIMSLFTHQLELAKIEGAKAVDNIIRNSSTPIEDIRKYISELEGDDEDE